MNYRRADDQLFGKYCYIDTPWIAGKKTVYRIVRSGVRSNTWCEVPIKFRDEPITHNHSEDIVFAVLDTLIDENTKIKRFALKDVEIIEDADRKTEPQTDGYMTAEQTEDYRKMLDKAEHKVYGNIEDEPQTITAEEKTELLDTIGGEFFPKDEPQYHADVECNYKDCDNCGHKDYCPQRKIESQRDDSIGCSKCEGRLWCDDRDKPNAVHCNNYGKTETQEQIVKDLADAFADDVTYEDLITGEAEAKGYAEGFKDGLNAQTEPQRSYALSKDSEIYKINKRMEIEFERLKPQTERSSE